MQQTNIAERLRVSFSTLTEGPSSLAAPILTEIRLWKLWGYRELNVKVTTTMGSLSRVANQCNKGSEEMFNDSEQIFN